MTVQSLGELASFHLFVGEKVGVGGAPLSPEEVLDEWRTLHPEAQAADDDLAAIQEAIDDMANGDVGIPFVEFDRDFRARHRLAAKQ